MTESEWRRAVLQAARNCRRAYRKADSAGEVFERWIDRQINRKTRIKAGQATKGIPLHDAYSANVQAFTRAYGDFIQVASL